MKKILKFSIAFIVIIIAIPLIDAFFAYHADTDEEAIERISLNNIDKILFKYETESNEILFYQDKNMLTYECILKKKNFFGKTKYKNELSWTSALLTSNSDFDDVNKNFKYAILDDKDDLKRFDYEGDELKQYEFSYLSVNGHFRYKYVYIIDNTNEKFDVVTNFYEP